MPIYQLYCITSLLLATMSSSFFVQAEKIQEKEGTPVIRTGTEPRRNSDNLALLISHLMTKHAQ